ncbi:hypothetical protein L1987_82766 [Smallanthus sonchifolius]|uniref:Uncharacterized protein n=1 Tax=Smallanthus sonchifolius TaxID=185202 RepID=A0ACB8YB06_9ASTR|nr:hypothetical protein L1987_82766 [Smallanthus sonchifolius]
MRHLQHHRSAVIPFLHYLLLRASDPFCSFTARYKNYDYLMATYPNDDFSLLAISNLDRDEGGWKWVIGRSKKGYGLEQAMNNVRNMQNGEKKEALILKT